MRWVANSIVKRGLFLAVVAMVISSSVNAGWEVEWIDKFDQSSVDWRYWTAQVQANYNNEKQCYTDDQSTGDRNLDVSNGTLKIIARKKQVACTGLNGQQREWTSARLNTKDKREFLYGRLEARIKFDTLDGGVWPAFWALENRIAEHPLKGDNDTVHWPNPGAGEIDIWEWFSNQGNSYITNFFNASGCGGEYRPAYAGGAADVTDFHVYAMEWYAHEIRFLMDETLVRTVDVKDCPQYKEPMFLLINLAVGGNLGGDIDPALTKSTLEIDYIAHCTKTDENVHAYCNESTPYANDSDVDGVSDNLDKCPETADAIAVDMDGCVLAINELGPQVAAPTPSHLASSVISLFSDHFYNIDHLVLDPNWGQSTLVSVESILENQVLKYTGLDYQGLSFEDNPQNLKEMHGLHIDVWSENTSTLAVFLINPGPVEKSYQIEVEQNNWQGVDIPLSEFSGIDLSQVFQLKIEGSGTVYLDNIYFYQHDDLSQQDQDHDGVVDNLDLCPNSQTAIVDETGCAISSEANLPPTITLSTTQNGSVVETVFVDNGVVTVEAVVEDANAEDTHQFIWTSSSLLTLQVNDSYAQFSPTELQTGNYQITVKVIDNGAPSLTASTTTQISINKANSNTKKGGTNSELFSLLLLLITARRTIFRTK